MSEQPNLIDIPEQPEQPQPQTPAPGKPRFIPLDRQQRKWTNLDIDTLIPAEHPARAIWALVGQLDLSGFEQDILCRGDRPGRSCWSPQLLTSIWVYAYSQGLASARAIQKQVDYEPGLRWLCADEEINHHTLSDFRTSRKEELEALFVQVLGVIGQEGLVDLETVMQDGTKVRAQSGRQSFHRRKTLEEHCQQAQALVEEMKRQEASGDPELTRRQLAARQRAARERVEPMEAALEQLKKREEEAGGKQSEQLRVSESEPDARKMKQPDGGWEASYNVQVLTDAKEKIVLGVSVTQAANDIQQLVDGLKLAEDNTGHKPERMVADGGYSSRENVEALAGQEVEFISPWKDGSKA